MMIILDLIVNNFPQIAGQILIISFTAYTTWRIALKSEKKQAINKFKLIFTNEREKLKRFDIQNYFDQEQAIFEISEYLSTNKNNRLKSMWQEYKTIEEQNRDASMPNPNYPHSLITYKNNKKDELINKVGEIIKFIK
ncbi:MAG: hypothetical protein V1782_04435 [Pseudomonadota bacterium]